MTDFKIEELRYNIIKSQEKFKRFYDMCKDEAILEEEEADKLFKDAQKSLIRLVDELYRMKRCYE